MNKREIESILLYILLCGIILFIVLYFRQQLVFYLKNLIDKLYSWNISKETMTENKNNAQQERAEIVPRIIYQTWSTKKLPLKMKECVESLKQANPGFEHYLYDDAECRDFIKKNFDKDVLSAYDKLKPGAYKADLWRYCILFKNGGIYVDIKFKPVGNFTFARMLDKEYFVLDRPFFDYNITLDNELKMVNLYNYYNTIYDNIDTSIWKNKKIGIYNAVIITPPENPLLYKCIRKIVDNCKSNYYGYNPLYITGPGLMGELMVEKTEDYAKYNQFSLFNSLKGNFILDKNGPILEHYREYRYEQKKESVLPYYDTMWRNGDVYNMNIIM